MKKLILLLPTVLVSCTDNQNTQPTTTTLTIEQMAVLDWSTVPGSDVWTTNLLEKLPVLGKNLLQSKPIDGKTFCQKFDTLSYNQKIDFYANMIANMARFESGFKPATEFYECNKTKNVYGTNARFDSKRGWCMRGGAKEDGGYVVSKGLLQMSIQSAKAYGCELKVSDDLKDPIKNLDCAIRILNRQIVKHNRIAGKTDKWNGAASYWSVMRDNGKDSFTKIKTRLNNLPYCKK